MNFGPIGSQFGGGDGIFGLIVAVTALWAAVAGYAGLARGVHKLFVDTVLSQGPAWQAQEHMGEIFRSSLALGYALVIGYFAFLAD